MRRLLVSRRLTPWLRVASHRVLPLPREVDRFTQDSRGLLRRVESGVILGFDEIQIELGLNVPVASHL
jgi:hypothetical protein